MLNEIEAFLIKNWSNLSLIVVGCSAFFIYWIKERRKCSEAASLIIMQVEELHKRIREMKTYIIEGQLHATAFYDSQLLFKTDYWDKYKFYFIKKLDPFNFNMFNEFYSCAYDVLAQQDLMKNLQKNDFYLGQQMLMNMEATLIIQTINIISQYPQKNDEMINSIMSLCPPEITSEQKATIENILKQLKGSNGINDINMFWQLYSKNRQIVTDSFNQKAFTPYTPVQIKISLEKALNQFDSIPIIACAGYEKLKKIADRKF